MCLYYPSVCKVKILPTV